MFACWSNLIRLLFPFKYPLKLDTLISGGIHTNQCIWSGQASASIISTPFHWHSFLFICPMSCLIFPYFTCLRYLGATTLWFMQFLVVWYTPCVDFQIVLLCLFARGWLDLLAWYHRSFSVHRLNPLWIHQLCWWFSLTKKTGRFQTAGKILVSLSFAFAESAFFDLCLWEAFP